MTDNAKNKSARHFNWPKINKSKQIMNPKTIISRTYNATYMLVRSELTFFFFNPPLLLPLCVCQPVLFQSEFLRIQMCVALIAFWGPIGNTSCFPPWPWWADCVGSGLPLASVCQRTPHCNELSLLQLAWLLHIQIVAVFEAFHK